MDFQQYQDALKDRQKLYPSFDVDQLFLIRSMELAEETGEVMGILKRLARGDYAGRLPEADQDLCKELGDVLANVALLADYFDLSLEDIAAQNLDKIKQRAKRNTLIGKGSDR